MDLIKKEPSSFDLKGNDSSQPIDKGALGVEFAKLTIEQRQSGGGNANTMQGVPGGEK